MQKNLKILDYTPQLHALFTIVRDKDTQINKFRFASDRITRLLLEESLNLLPTKPKTVYTPTDSEFSGCEYEGKIFAVSILRAGESMEKAVNELCPGIKIGKILIQRNEKTHQPKKYFAKLPKDASERYALLLDPMLATGGSACSAIQTLKDYGVKESKTIFVNLVSCPEGLEKVFSSHPEIKIVTAFVDKGLNENKYIIPGLGDFGDRYFGT